MKILLANFPWKKGRYWGVRAGSRWPHIKTAEEKKYLPYPFFMAYAAALLKREGFDVTVIDAVAEEISIHDFVHRVSAGGWGLLVAETSPPSLDNDLSILRRLPAGLPVALCGPEINIRTPAFLEKHPGIHFVLQGEYEMTLLELVRRICSHRYGIHGMPGEHFGMSVAEMLTGGCIVFVPDGGGQTEIVGACAELRYLGPDDAVRKIHAVLSSADEQERLRACLAPRRELFSVERFTHRIREIVDEFAQKRQRASC